MSNSSLSIVLTLLGPLLLTQIAIVAISLTVCSVRRKLGYRGYVALGQADQSEFHVREAHPVRRAPDIVKSAIQPAHSESETPWRHEIPPEAVRQFWSYPARPSPARARKA